MKKASRARRHSEEAVREALSALARGGLGAIGSMGAEGIFELLAVRRETAAVSPVEAVNVVRGLLAEAIEEVPTQDYRELLRIVLQLDPATKGLSAGDRRDLAGRRFRGGERPVAGGTIRQYHEPRALDQLAAALVALDESRSKRRPRAATGDQRLLPASNFGDPDGARADPATVLDEFVPIDFGDGRPGGLENGGVDRRVRVIVGRKGSGKTLYLRRLNLTQRKDPSIYADLVSTRMPPTDQIVRIDGFYPEPLITELWSALWRVAILRSALSHVIHAADLNSFLDGGDLLELRRVYGELGGTATTPREIGSELRDLLFDLSHRAKLEKVLAGSRVDEAEYLLAFHLRRLPPLHFFLDGLDDEFSHAPVQWLRCQKGLFHQVMSITRNDRLSRLRLTVALRDLVHASIARSEHASRYQDSPYVLHLRWTSRLARRFLEAKVNRLAREATVGGDASPDVSAWLGRQEIFDPAENRETLLVDYLVRHTRALPRDIVVLGNMLCHEVAARAGAPLPEEAIRATTQSSARLFGWEQLAITATQITSILMPSGPGVDGYVEIYGEGTPYARYGAEQLAELLSPYATGGMLSRADLDRLSAAAREVLDFDDLLSLLWENDLLGAGGPEGEVSYRYEVPGDDLRAPVGTTSFRLHPILVAALTPARKDS